MATKQQNRTVHKEGLDRFHTTESSENEQRRLGVEDIRFAQTPDGQWDDLAKKKRQGRPRYTLNKIAAAIDTIVGDQRQNEITSKVVALSNDATEADTYDGIIRNIEAQSSAKNIYDQAFDEQLNSGYGGWRITTQFIDDSFVQEIRIEPVRAATTSLWFDRDAKQYDKRDARFAFLTWTISIEEFKRLYPKATVSDFTQKKYAASRCATWFDGDNIRLAEYWRKVPIKRTIAQLSDGRIIDVKDEQTVLDELRDTGITVLQTRVADSHKVERYIMNGAEILEGPEAWAGRYIPLIPLYGKINHIENETHVRGLVRFAKDAQRIYNYLRSSLVETTALTPKDPYWITTTQAKGRTAQLARMATDNPPFQIYNEDPKAPGPPKRTGSPSVDQAMIEQSQSAQLDITQTLGVSAGTPQPTAGTDLDMRSGKAIEAQARRGDAGAFVFADNLVKSMEYSSVVLVDLIPRIIDTEQQIRILQPDGTEEMKLVNQTVLDTSPGGTGKPVIVNDLTAGKYDVKAKTGPLHATQREKAATMLQELATGNPAFATVTPDLIAKSLDTPMSDELHKRIRKQMIAQGIAEPTEEEAQEMQVEEQKTQQLVEQLTAQITQQVEQQANVRLLNAEAGKREAEVEALQASTGAKIEKTTADANKSELDSNKTANETLGVMLDNIAKQLELGIPIDQVTHNLRVSQNDLINVSQQEIAPGPNSEQQQQQQQQLQQQLIAQLIPALQQPLV